MKSYRTFEVNAINLDTSRKYLLTVMDSGTVAEGNTLLKVFTGAGWLTSTLVIKAQYRQ